MLSQTVQVKKKRPQVAPEPTKLERIREAKKIREKWLLDATEDELREALKMKSIGGGMRYILHPTIGPVNYSLVKSQLDTRFHTPTPNAAEESYTDKKLRREENKLYALNITNSKLRLEILTANMEKLSHQQEINPSDKTLCIKLSRILDEINKIKQ
jgi:hypothetical protein